MNSASYTYIDDEDQERSHVHASHSGKMYFDHQINQDMSQLK